MSLSLLLAALLVLLACPTASRAAGSNPWLERRFLNMAHAGGEHEAPTDTLFADKRALAAGANLIELDVRRTKDGALIMSHDETADRVTDGTGSWLDLTLEQVKRLDNAYNFECTASCEVYGDERHPLRGIATGQRPPPPGFTANDFRVATIREVLEAFPDTLLSIEIKGEAPQDIPTAEALADLLREFGRSDDVLVASFDMGLIQAFKARAPEVNTSPSLIEMANFYFNRVIPTGHAAFQVPPDYSGLKVVTPELVKAAHDIGFAVYVFLDDPIENEAMYERLLAADVDGITTARPTRMQALLEERGLAFRSRLELAANAVPGGTGVAEIPLHCRASAATRTCRADLSLELVGLGRRALRPGSPLRIAAGRAEVRRGETGSVRLRLSPMARLLLAWFGPLETRLRLSGRRPIDADAAAPLRVEPALSRALLRAPTTRASPSP